MLASLGRAPVMEVELHAFHPLLAEIVLSLRVELKVLDLNFGQFLSVLGSLVQEAPTPSPSSLLPHTQDPRKFHERVPT